jgi:murein DD-endopeptidase MepM/ murein hydrolase activator NlpD
LIILGLLIPEKMIIPVQNATKHDWHQDTFWYAPWGSSGVHKGIDIFGRKGTNVLTATTGIVVYSGTIKKGGIVLAILGPKWRIHYYAHLDQSIVNTGDFVSLNSKIATLGDTGNAAGKQPHVHYSILSLLPIPWLASFDEQGWKKMFYLNPSEKLQQNSE